MRPTPEASDDPVWRLFADVKGLYAKAMAGEIDNFIGICSPYEAPENMELVVETNIHNVDEIVAQFINDLKVRGILLDA